DLTQAAPPELARDAVRKFIHAIDKRDLVQLEKVMDETINISGVQTMRRDDLLKQLKDAPATPDQKITVAEVKSTKPADVMASLGPEAAKCLESFAKERVQLVALEANQGNRK